MNLARQKIIIIDGPIGSGKSTVAGLLYKALLHTVFLSVDKIKWLNSSFSRFNEADQIMADKVILGMCKEYLKAGLSVVIERSFRRKSMIQPYLNLSRRLKLPLLVYELTAPKSILISRIRHRTYVCPGKKNPPLWRIMTNINAYPHELYAPVRLKLDSLSLSARQIANHILKDIKQS